MTQMERLKQLLTDIEGQPIHIQAEYLTDNGVRVTGVRTESYDYSRCPYRKGKDDCTVMACMICKDPHRHLPCGFFPDEVQRRKDIFRRTGKNVFKG